MCTECPQNAKCCLGIRYSEVKTIILLSFGNVWTLLSSSFISWLHHYFQSLNGMCCLPQLLNCGVGEDSSGSLGLQEIQPVHSEGDQPWDFFERNDTKAETPRVDSLEKSSPRGHEELERTWWLNNNKPRFYLDFLSSAHIASLSIYQINRES